MQKSWRHHYLPQFYLKGFTNENGTFKIYDVTQGKFLKNGKEFPPASYFFERNANTIQSDKVDSEHLEKFYQEHETPVSEIIKKINANTEGRFGISHLELMELMFFLSLLYYRLPHVKEKTQNNVINLDFDKLGITINPQMIEEGHIYNPDFIKLSNIVAPLGNFGRIKTSLAPQIFPFPEELPAIISDNPFIYLNEETFDIHTDPFLFPLSKTRVLFQTPTLKPFWNTITIKVDIDLLVFKQAKRYVACTNKEYINKLEDYFNKDIQSVEFLRYKIFRDIIKENRVKQFKIPDFSFSKTFPRP